ncbi:hypothetical protein SCHPADRAFT_940590 [Schizopora paradoxa]|uniref:DRBM domain-containing protein n=1 Tax=Schizopora paradoxa TaxID=27342 RepID=A0A0H2RUV5_9AGAM|nr:hypothetical protein SCHPADRAFT_940590 [Schizopora paradoxa]
MSTPTEHEHCKMKLNNHCQSQRDKPTPIYDTVHEGSEHAGTWKSSVSIQGEEKGTGQHTTKKGAEEAAAKAALEAMGIPVPAQAQ